MLTYSSWQNHIDDLCHDDEHDLPQDITRRKTACALVKLYALGDFLGDVRFKNEAIKGFAQGFNDRVVYPWYEAVKMTFENTPQDCSLQRLLADIMASMLKDAFRVDTLVEISPNVAPAVL